MRELLLLPTVKSKEQKEETSMKCVNQAILDEVAFKELVIGLLTLLTFTLCHFSSDFMSKFMVTEHRTRTHSSVNRHILLVNSHSLGQLQNHINVFSSYF